MRALVFHGVGRLSVEERAPRALAPHEVRVEVASVGVCGSDVHGYVGANQRRVPGMIMGHEAVGVISELGAEVEGLEVGTPVAINPATSCDECDACRTGADNLCPQRALYGCVLALPGAFADEIVVDARNAVPFVGPAPVEWGALVEPFAVGDRCAGQLDGALDRGVLVIGGGPIGIGAALAARRRGAARVVVSEPQEHRRSVLERLGLETIEPAALADAPPFDGALECVALGPTLEAALNAVVPRGQVSLVGLAEPEIPLPVMPLVVGERMVRGSFTYTRADYRAVAEWLASGEVDLAPIIEARVTLDELPDVFATYAAGTNSAVKTLFQPAALSERARQAGVANGAGERR